MWPWRAKNLKLDVLTVADVDDEDRVGNSWLHIWNLRFGHKAKLWAHGLVKILKLKFRRDFEAEVWSVFCEIILLNLGQDSEAGFGHDLKSRYWCLVEILKLMLCNRESENLCKNLWYELNPRVRCALGIGNVFKWRLSDSLAHLSLILLVMLMMFPNWAKFSQLLSLWISSALPDCFNHLPGVWGFYKQCFKSLQFHLYVHVHIFIGPKPDHWLPL